MIDVPDEEWRPTVGFNGYEVSNIGRVRRTKAGSGTVAGKILKDQYDTNGYPMVHLWVDGTRYGIKIHRLVAEAFLPPRPSPEHCVAHNDGKPLNKRVSNLRWATASENQRDRIAHGTSARGEGYGAAVLCEKSVKRILSMRQAGCNIGFIAQQIGAQRGTVSAVLRGKSWAWLTGITEESRDRKAHLGHNHHASKLSDEQVAFIRQSPLPQVELARMFGVSPASICLVKQRKVRKDLP